MDEQKFTGEPLDLSFPAVQKQWKANGQDERTEPSAASGDIVDTFWDFQPLTFPNFAGDIDQKGPRHAEPKRGILGARSGDGETDTLPAMHDGESNGAADHAAADTASLPSAASTGTMRNGNRTVAEDAQQTMVLAPQRTGAPANAAADAFSAASGDGSDKTPGRSGKAGAGKPSGDKGKRKTALIVVAVIVAVIAVVGGGFALWRSNQASRHQAAVNDCAKAAERYNTAKKALNKAVAKATKLESVTESQVSDAKTIKQLKQQLEVAKQFSAAPSCAAKQSTATLQTNAKAMSEQIADMTTSSNAVSQSAGKLSASKADKDLKSLKDVVTTAQKLLTDSEGKVSDDSTRTALQKAIDEANALISKKSTDDTAITNALSALRSASDKVNDSVSAASAEASQNSTDGYDTSGSTSTDGTYGNTGYNNGYYNYGYYNNGYYNNRNTYGGGGTGSDTGGQTDVDSGDNSDAGDKKPDSGDNGGGAGSGNGGNNSGNGGNTGTGNNGNNSGNGGNTGEGNNTGDNNQTGGDQQ